MWGMEGDNQIDQTERTRPPVTALRYDTPSELYAGLPQIRELTQLRPKEDETHFEFLGRLHASNTPEEIVTYTAFAARPRMAVWWGYECLRNLRGDFTPDDRALLEHIASWCTDGDTEKRYHIMKTALFAERKTSVVHLGLATGWCGAQIAPNDPAPVPAHRAPRGVNAAVLSALAQCHLINRPAHLAVLRNLAESLLRA